MAQSACMSFARSPAVFEQLLHLRATNGRNSWTKRIRLVAQSVVHFVIIPKSLIKADCYREVGIAEVMFWLVDRQPGTLKVRNPSSGPLGRRYFRIADDTATIG
jgi:hypothetical protein